MGSFEVDLTFSDIRLILIIIIFRRLGRYIVDRQFDTKLYLRNRCYSLTFGFSLGTTSQNKNGYPGVVRSYILKYRHYYCLTLWTLKKEIGYPWRKSTVIKKLTIYKVFFAEFSTGG